MNGDKENDSPARDGGDGSEQLEKVDSAKPQGRIWKTGSESQNSVLDSVDESEDENQSESIETTESTEVREDEGGEASDASTTNEAVEPNGSSYPVAGYGNSGYLERIHDELRRRESELARLDREIDGLTHWLERAKPKRQPFIGSAGLLSSQGNFVKELRDRLTRKRIARATMLIEVTRARERLESEE